MIVYANDIRADEGSIVVFEGSRDEGPNVLFGVDHRMAQGLAEIIEEEGECACEVEVWPILGILDA